MPVCVSPRLQERHEGRDQGPGTDRAPEAARPADERRCRHDPHGGEKQDELGDQDQGGLLEVAESTRGIHGRFSSLSRFASGDG